MSEFTYETYGEYQVELPQGWYTLRELKEIVADLEEAERRHKQARKQMMEVKK